MGDLRFGGLLQIAVATTEPRSHMIVYRCRPFEDGNQRLPPAALRGRKPQTGAQKILYYDGLEFADAEGREQPFPPTALGRFRSDTAAIAKDRSAIASIDGGSALVSFKEMPIAPVEANQDAGNVTRGKIGDLPVDRASFISHFERR